MLPEKFWLSGDMNQRAILYFKKTTLNNATENVFNNSLNQSCGKSS